MAKSKSGEPGSRPNTIGLSSNELHRLLNTLDQGRKPGSANRSHARWQYNQASLPVQIIHPTGNEVHVRMACRNLSKGGIALLHRSFLHLGTQCNVTLTDPHHGEVIVSGRVVRCIHIAGMIHEIGIAFENEIEIREIIRPDPMQELFAVERADPASLVGTILLVEDSDMDARLVRHYLRDTQLRIKHVSTLADAEREAKSGVGLILCDIHLGGEDGGRLPKRLHEIGAPHPPVIMVSADTSQSTRDLVGHPAVQGFLAKPFTQDNLIRAIAEFFREPEEGEGDGSGGPGASSLDRQVYEAMMPELRKTVDKLVEAAEAGDTARVLAVLMQLRGVAPVLGHADLAMLLETMTFQLSSDLDIAAIRDQIGEVKELCGQIAGGT